MSIYRRALRRAIQLEGARRVAEALHVSVDQLTLWASGAAAIPGWVSERAIDMVMEADVAALLPKRVLAVDDDPGAAYYLAHLLRSMGYAVETALSGEDAIAMARRFQPHVVFIDLRMPDMDGCDLAAILRAEPYRPRIIASTAYGEVEDRRRTSAAGFEAHLLKPIDAAMLEPYLPRMT